ncbi:unnamed protein product [Rodentolepis nana]|uniref:Uncharacterized protein n=1 Tax=Rodentolepis nana TaxID=102285 RepID=A0A3P7UYZ5_RODNA|nr:unnamed protein product [Rodentolepis nana]
MVDTVGCGTAEECFRICGNRYGCSDWAYPKLVMGIMPDGLRGLMLAVMLAALMSDLTSIFNSSSTLFTVDIYTSFRRKASNRELMLVGRLFVLVMVGLSIIWVPVIQSMQGGQLYIYIQSIAGFLSPPIAAVYVMALMWKRNNELGAFTGLIYGFVIGIVRMILSFIYADPICGEPDNRPWIVAKVHYMYFAMFSFFSTGLVMCLVSLASYPPTEEQIRGLTFWTRNEVLTPNGQLTFDDDDNSFATKIDGAMLEVRFGDEISRRDTEDEEEEKVDGEKNGLASKKFIVEELDTTVEIMENDAEKESKEDISVKSTRSHCSRCLYISGHVCQWFWGFSDDPCPSDIKCCCGKLSLPPKSNAPMTTADEALNFSPISLQQNRNVKIGLFIGLVFIVSITVFLFCFFSLYFGLITRGPLRLIGNSTSKVILEAVKKLQDYNMIAY